MELGRLDKMHINITNTKYFTADNTPQISIILLHIPLTYISNEAVDGTLLATVHLYIPPVLAVRLWLYRAVTASTNTLSVPSVTVVESLVQVTLVAGPPVETQVMVNGKLDQKSTLKLTEISPVDIAH